MPELPDIVAYCVALDRVLVGHELQRVVVQSPFLLRTVQPDLFSAQGQVVRRIERMGKRVVWELDGTIYLIFHLMIAGRFHWRKPGVQPNKKSDLAAFCFEHGTLMLTEASKKKRAALYVAGDRPSLRAYDPQGLEVLECSEQEFRQRLQRRNHTLKRALTDPKLFSGIGNAYSDEILHEAGMSPLRWTSRLSDEEIAILFRAVQSTLQHWMDHLVEEAERGFPERVTAFRPEMRVHGKYGEPCQVCDTKIQRIVYAENEVNYCPRCQTDGKILADRSLSRLLKGDWPKTIEELEG